jgi:hypothetical protein
MGTGITQNVVKMGFDDERRNFGYRKGRLKMLIKSTSVCCEMDARILHSLY